MRPKNYPLMMLHHYPDSDLICAYHLDETHDREGVLIVRHNGLYFVDGQCFSYYPDACSAARFLLEESDSHPGTQVPLRQ